MKQTIDITTSTLLRFVLIILGLIFLYLIRDILIMVFVALIIAAAVDGPVDWLAKHHVRRIFGTILIYAFVFGVLAMFMYLAFPPLAGQLKGLASELPNYLDKFGVGSLSSLKERIVPEYGQQILGTLSNHLSGATSNIFGTAVTVFGGIFSAMVIFVISIYLVIQDKGIKNFLMSVMPEEHRVYAGNLAERMQSKLGGWLRGQIVLMFIIGFLTFIGLTLLRVKFALTLGLLTGILEIIPYIGPIMAGMIAIIMAFLQSPVLALLVFALYILIHELEAYVFGPLIMKRIIGLNPLIAMLSVIIGSKLGGFWGVLIAVPLVGALSVFWDDVFLRKDK